MKRGKKLLIMLIVLVVIAAACVLAAVLVPKDTAKSVDEEESTEIMSVNADDITELKWNYNDEDLSFSHADGSWTYSDDDKFPSDETTLNIMADLVSEVTASKAIDAPENLSEYGLDEPYKTVTISTGGDNASTVTLNFGNTTEISGEVYCSDGDGKVYLVDSSLPEGFDKGLYDVVQEEEIPAMNDIKSITVKNSSDTLEIENHDGEGLAYSDSYIWFSNKNGDLSELDTELTESFIDNIKNLTWQSCVNYKADQESLAEYGLEEPMVDVTVKYITEKETEESSDTETADTEESSDTETADTETADTETADTEENSDTEAADTEENSDTETAETEDDSQSADVQDEKQENEFEILLGKGQDGNFYAMIKGSSMVYTVNESVFDSLAYTTYNDLQPDEVLSIDWDNVNGIDVTLDGTTYKLEKVTREVTAEEETEAAEEDQTQASENETAETENSITDEADEGSEEVQYETVWTMDGQDVAIENVLDELTSMASTGYANGAEPEHDAEVSFVIHTDNEKYPEITLTFYGYNSTSCLVVRDGKSTVFVTRDDVVNLTEELKELFVF